VSDNIDTLADLRQAQRLISDIVTFERLCKEADAKLVMHELTALCDMEDRLGLIIGIIEERAADQ
jgi:hypothetical protein